MNQRLLLSSTALVSAGVLLAGMTPAARAQGPSPITVTLSGYTEVGMHSGTDETMEPGPDQGYTGFEDTEIHVQAQGTSDGGVTYGSYVAIDLYQPEDSDETSNVHTDEAKLFFSGGFGRIEVGRDDGVEDVMFVGAEDAQSGTGGLDGDGKNLPTAYHLSNGDGAKLIYFTPRIAGFQLGADVVPDVADDSGNDTTGLGNSVAVGANWVGAFGGVDLTVSAGGVWSNNHSGDDQKDFEVGGLIGAGGLSFGVTAGVQTDLNEGNFVDLGLKYKFAGASASVGFVRFDPDNGDTQYFYVVSGDIGLMPGVTLKADVSYNDSDPGAHDAPPNPDGSIDLGTTDDTWSGVLSVQLDY